MAMMNGRHGDLLSRLWVTQPSMPEGVRLAPVAAIDALVDRQ
jgi:hypothetical protein